MASISGYRSVLISPGYRMRSFSVARHTPADSCSSASRYRPGMADGSDAMLWNRSVFLNGTWQISHDDVPMQRCASKSRTAPAPMAAAMMSGAPLTTCTDSGSPSSPAAAGASVPSTVAGGTSSGSFARSSPAIFKSRSS